MIRICNLRYLALSTITVFFFSQSVQADIRIEMIKTALTALVTEVTKYWLNKTFNPEESIFYQKRLKEISNEIRDLQDKVTALPEKDVSLQDTLLKLDEVVKELSSTKRDMDKMKHELQVLKEMIDKMPVALIPVGEELPSPNWIGNKMYEYPRPIVKDR